MSQYDLAIGMNHDTLDQGFSQLYADSQAREKLFKGTQTGEQGSLKYTAQWDVQKPPTFILSPPPEDKWRKSIDKQGVPPKESDGPAQNAFQLSFPEFYGEYKSETANPVSGVTEVIVFIQVELQGEKLSLKPLSVWLDESKMPVWDQFILNQVILKEVLAKAETMLSGVNIPPLSFSESGVEIELTSPVVTVQDNLLIMAASLKSKNSVDISGVSWPKDQPLFVLMSQDVLNQLVQGLAKQVEGKTFSDNGEKNGGQYSYTATLQKLDDVALNPQDLTKMTANVLFAFQAQVAQGVCSITSATNTLSVKRDL